MAQIQLNREQWWLLCATYAAALFLQRDNLREPNTATAFLIVGALLLVWRLSQEKVVPSDLDARRSVITIVSVTAVLSLGGLILYNWPSFQSDTATSSDAFHPPPALRGVSQQPGARTTNPEPDGQSPISPADLLLEFQANDFASDEKYRDRFIQVAGEVATVVTGPKEVAYLELSLRPKRVDPMQALFPKNAGQLKGVKAGDRVTVSCSPRYDGDLDDVTLNDCSLVK
jgi:hypothetical protein